MPTIADLEKRVGGLSRPSKMPGFAWSIPATKCKLGTILRKKTGSTCASCYALKGRYVFPVVRAAMARRFRKLRNLSRWTEDMVAVINARAQRPAGKHFRWHDSGDLQSEAHFGAIVMIARECPDVQFWLPTREWSMVRNWIDRYGKNFLPTNLCIRISAQMVGRRSNLERRWGAATWVQRSTVNSGVGYQCPAPDQGNQCGACRACWDRGIPNVDYAKH